MIENRQIALIRFDETMIHKIWEIGFKENSPEWSKWDGPYFENYKSYENVEVFEQSSVWEYLQSEDCMCITVDNEPVGMVSRHWECEKTRWMEVGIVIYNITYWSKGIGTQAMKLWLEQTFNEYPLLERLGLTTWSGNIGMMKSAEKLGMLKEAQIRKVRYWQGVYYDSVKYGILRKEFNI